MTVCRVRSGRLDRRHHKGVSRRPRHRQSSSPPFTTTREFSRRHRHRCCAPALRGPVARELVAPARGRRETFLFCGWRRDIDDMIILLDSNVVAGSELHLLSDVPFQERATRFARGGFDEVSVERTTTVVCHIRRIA